MSKQEPLEGWSDFRVGVVVFIALLLIVLGIGFAGGDKGLLFQKRAVIRAHLANVGGLKTGSSVTMGGMAVGRVIHMGFAGVDAHQIEVVMQVRQDIRQKIKVDSEPSVQTQGMLGDRYIDISAGSDGAQVLPEAQPLIGKAATSFDETLQKAISVMGESNKILLAINDQKGTVGKLFYDERFYNNLVQITDELNSFIKDFKKQPRKYIKFSII